MKTLQRLPRALNKAPLLERFWRRVNKQGPPHPRLGRCWQWIGYITKAGYGRLMRETKHVRSHKLSYELLIGPIPEGMGVLHACDNRACVNPTHLFLGSPADNTRDAVSKARHPSREKHGMAKLTSMDVQQIRQSYVPGKRGKGAHVLAKRYGVTAGAIYAVLKYQTWKEDFVEAGPVFTVATGT